MIQAALGGHSVPIDATAMKVMQVLDLVKEKDVAAGSVPGLERAIPKNKGIEFGSLLHRFAVDFAATPHKPDLKKILLEIDPEAGPRLPKRRTKVAAKEVQAPKSESTKKSRASKATAKKAAAQPKKATTTPKKAAKGKSKRTTSKPSKKTAAPQKKTAKTKAGKASSQKRSTSKGLSKKKPR